MCGPGDSNLIRHSQQGGIGFQNALRQLPAHQSCSTVCRTHTCIRCLHTHSVSFRDPWDRQSSCCEGQSKHVFVLQGLNMQNIKLNHSYLLGLLAMIKCSICSYQCDNWYVSNWRLACHIIFDRGGCLPGLPGAPQMLPWHGTLLWATHPHGVTQKNGAFGAITFSSWLPRTIDLILALPSW